MKRDERNLCNNYLCSDINLQPVLVLQKLLADGILYSFQQWLYSIKTLIN